MWRSLRTPNKWMAEVAVEAACLGNTNHLSWRRDQWRSGQYVQVVTRQQKPLPTWKLLNVYTKADRLAVVSFVSQLRRRDNHFDNSLVEQQWTVFHQWTIWMKPHVQDIVRATASHKRDICSYGPLSDHELFFLKHLSFRSWHMMLWTDDFVMPVFFCDLAHSSVHLLDLMQDLQQVQCLCHSMQCDVDHCLVVCRPGRINLMQQTFHRSKQEVSCWKFSHYSFSTISLFNSKNFN